MFPSVIAPPWQRTHLHFALSPFVNFATYTLANPGTSQHLLLQSELSHTTSALTRNGDPATMERYQQYGTQVKDEDDELENWIPIKQEQGPAGQVLAVVPKAGSSGEVSALSLLISSPNSTLLSSNAYTNYNVNSPLLLPIDAKMPEIVERLYLPRANANADQEPSNRQRECA